MPAQASPYAYAVVRVVPNIERGEFINAGVVLFARQHDFLGLRLSLDRARLAAGFPDADPPAIADALNAYERVARGERSAGPIAALSKSERFGWLVAPSSTVIQCSEVHTGLSDDPQRQLDTLFDGLVA